MEMTIINKGGVKHAANYYAEDEEYVGDGNETLKLRVTRYRTMGGVPISVIREVPRDATFMETMETIHRLINLDDEMWALILEHTKSGLLEK